MLVTSTVSEPVGGRTGGVTADDLIVSTVVWAVSIIPAGERAAHVVLARAVTLHLGQDAVSIAVQGEPLWAWEATVSAVILHVCAVEVGVAVAITGVTKPAHIVKARPDVEVLGVLRVPARPARARACA